MNTKQMADTVLLAVRSFVDGATATITKRIDAIEARVASVKDGRDGAEGQRGADGINGRDGVDGINGKDGAPGINGRDGIDGRDGEKGEQGPAGERGADGRDGVDGKNGLDGAKGMDGAPGRDGVSVDPEQVKSMLAEMVKSIPAGRDGKDGKDGQSIHPDTVAVMVSEAVSKAAAAMPRPEHGKDGRDGRDGKDVDPEAIAQEVRKAVAELPKPQDGKSITLDDVRPMLEAEIAKWELDFERRSQAVIQRAIDRMPLPQDGKDGANGTDGRDGLNLDDFDCYMKEDGRTLVIKLDNGNVQKSREFKLAVPIYRGVFKAGEAYAKGDTITYGGSLYIAQTDNPAAPGDGSSWRLAVKRGADAK